MAERSQKETKNLVGSQRVEKAAVAPVVSEQQEAVVPAVFEQQKAWSDPTTLQGQSESANCSVSARKDDTLRAHGKENTILTVLEGRPNRDLLGVSQKQRTQILMIQDTICCLCLERFFFVCY